MMCQKAEIDCLLQPICLSCSVILKLAEYLVLQVESHLVYAVCITL